MGIYDKGRQDSDIRIIYVPAEQNKPISTKRNSRSHCANNTEIVGIFIVRWINTVVAANMREKNASLGKNETWLLFVKPVRFNIVHHELLGGSDMTMLSIRMYCVHYKIAAEPDFTIIIIIMPLAVAFII